MQSARACNVQGVSVAPMLIRCAPRACLTVPGSRALSSARVLRQTAPEALKLRTRDTAVRRPVVRVSASSDESADSGSAKQLITTSYALLAMALGAASVGKVFLTKSYAASMFDAAVLTSHELLMIKAAGVGMAVTAASLWVLADASSNHRLGNDTYKRLNAGMFLSGALTLALTNAFRDVLLPRAYTVLMVAAGVKAATTAFVHVSLTGLNPMSTVEGVVHSARMLLRNESIIGSGYSTVCAAFAALGIHHFIAGIKPAGVTSNDLSAFLVGNIAISYLVSSVVAYVLKDGADRKRLASSTFKTLNAALAAFGIGGTAILLYGAKQELFATSTQWIIRLAACGLAGVLSSFTLAVSDESS